MNGIETFTPPRGGVLAIALAIESRSDSEASNRSFREAETLSDQVLNSPGIKAAKSKSVFHGGQGVLFGAVKVLLLCLKGEEREGEVSNSGTKLQFN
jgi:hypothetical protein